MAKKMILVEKFVGIRSRVDEILELTGEDSPAGQNRGQMDEIRKIALAIREEL